MAGTASLSPSGEHALIITEDNNLYLYSTKDSTRPPLRLSEKMMNNTNSTTNSSSSSSYSAVGWLSSLSTGTDTTLTTNVPYSYIVLGNTNGTVTIWDTQTAEIKAKFGNTVVTGSSSSSSKKNSSSSSSSSTGNGIIRSLNTVTTIDGSVHIYTCSDPGGAVNSSVASTVITYNYEPSFSSSSSSSSSRSSSSSTSATASSTASSTVLHTFMIDHKRSCSRIVCTSDETTLFAGSTDIRILDLGTKKTLKRLGGHSTPITSLILSQDNTVCLSSSDDRSIHLWDMKDTLTEQNFTQYNLKSSEPIPPTRILLQPSRPLPDTLQCLKIKKGTYHVSCVGEDGKGYIYRYKRTTGTPEELAKPLSPSCVIIPEYRTLAGNSKVSSGLHTEIPKVLQIQLYKSTSASTTTVTNDDDVYATVVVGPLATPSVYTTNYVSADGKHLRESIVLQVQRTNTTTVPKRKDKEDETMDTNDGGNGSSSDNDSDNDNTGSKGTQITNNKEIIGKNRDVVSLRGKDGIKDESTDNNVNTSSKKRNRNEEDNIDMDEDILTASGSIKSTKIDHSKKLKNGTDDDDDDNNSDNEEDNDESTLGQRMQAVIATLRNPNASNLLLASGLDLASLEAEPPSNQQAFSSSSSSSSISPSPPSHANPGQTVAEALVSSTGSLAVVLSQALQSRDDNQLETILAITDKGVIASTVARLPSPFVLPFLSRIVNKFQAKPSRGILLLTWLRTVLITHTGYLLSQPNLVSTLEQLYTIIDTRVTVYKKLLKLSGRLDLLLAQVNTSEDVSEGNGNGGRKVSTFPSIKPKLLQKAKYTISQSELEAQNTLFKEEEVKDDDDDDNDDGDDDDDNDDDEEEADNDEDDDFAGADEDLDEDDEDDEENDDDDGDE